MRFGGIWIGSLTVMAATLWLGADVTMSRAHAAEAAARNGDDTPAPQFMAAETPYTACIHKVSTSSLPQGEVVPETYWPLSLFAANADNIRQMAPSPVQTRHVQFVMTTNGATIIATSGSGLSLIRKNDIHHVATPRDGQDDCAPL
ncbi:MAG: hypothetical protein GC184_06650 [Rhizobiales bacterium]|nr:hypothetical protein [Hyphomicrobiales bacterium]